MNFFTVFILSLFLTIALVPVFKRIAFKMHIVDVPDERKVHLAPMPKTGGISMAVGIFIPLAVWLVKDQFVSAVLLGAVVIVIFGIVDDIRPLSAKQKIVPQIAAALIVIFLGNVRITSLGAMAMPDFILPWFLSVPLTLLVILGVTNAINLADGLDGLAGGISMLSFILIAFLAYQCGNMQIALMSLAIVGAVLGFLRYNTYPAILFMGDAGSQMLGFLSIVFAIVLTQSNTPYSKILALPIIGFPILDTLTVMVERLIKKRSPFSPDKNHFHHRLLRFNFFHTEAVLIIYIIQAVFILFALKTRFYSEWVHVGGFIALSAAILVTMFFARINHFELNRQGSFDTKIKSGLKVLKEKNLFIRISFGGLRHGFFLILACQAVIPKEIPLFFTAACGVLLVFTFAASRFDFKLKNQVLRFAVYLVIPFLIYVTESMPAGFMDGYLPAVNNAFFIALVLMIVLTLNLTRRRKGFKISPMDILVFIVVLVFPNLSSMEFFAVHHTGIVVAKVLILFFGYDVIMGELRKESGILIKPVTMVLGLIVLRGFTG